MKQFTGYQYLLIDICNNNPFDGDKLTYEERLEWAEEFMSAFEDIADNNQWKERPLFIKAVMALRDAQAGKPLGHMMGFDAVCSGMQIMSVLSGCYAGAKATGLVDTHRRPDAYTDVDTEMGNILGIPLENSRKRVKNATMTCLYGSKKEPKKEFGEDTPELDAFHKALFKVAPGACMMLDNLLASWQPWALRHEWKLPDGFTAKVKVIQKVETKVEIDELNHSTFTYTYSINEGEERGVKNAANVIHSVDAYILRSLIRRCSYNREHAEKVEALILAELIERAPGQNYGQAKKSDFGYEIGYYAQQYRRSTVADITILPYIDASTIGAVSSEHLKAIKAILWTMLQHQPFDVVAVHDDFKCHPNDMNHLRIHYRNILAELADSDLMADLLSQIHGVEGGTYQKMTHNLSEHIMGSSYAIC